VFLFSGQANLYRGMGAELFTTAPVFRKAVLECSRVLCQYGVIHVENFIASKSDENQDDVLSQCACFVLQYALANLWQSWGVEPQLVIGHSLGEYAAFVVSGILKLEDALMLIAKRAQLMVSRCAHGASGMVACKLSIAAVHEVSARLFQNSEPLVVACDNTPEDCVVAGDLDSLRIFLEHCKTEGIKAKQLQVPFAFHSPAMEPINQAFRQLCLNVNLECGTITLASSHLGKVLSPDDLTADYLPGQTRNSVKFTEAIGSLMRVADGRRLRFVEIGHSSGSE
jgi:acyl transferase domain-containing protein